MSYFYIFPLCYLGMMNLSSIPEPFHIILCGIINRAYCVTSVIPPLLPALLYSFLGVNGISVPQSKGPEGTLPPSQFILTHYGPHPL